MNVEYRYGKIILIGDQFINYGIPTILSAINMKTKANIERETGYGTNWRVEDNRKGTPGYKRTKIEQQKESILRILEAMKINPQENRIKIVFEGDLVAASGPGASAASCVALARALNAEFQLGPGDEEINKIAYEGEKA